MQKTIKLIAGPINSLYKKLNIIGLSPLSLILFIILGLSPSLIKEEYLMHLLVICLLFGTLAMGFDLSAGYIGVANWGYGALMGLGAYTSALLMMKLGISPWIGIFAGALLAGLLGLMIGLLTLRMEGMFAAILAWFVGLVLMALCAALVPLTRGALGLNVDLFFDTGWAKQYAYVMLIICFVTFIALRMITRSNLGLAFNALGQDVEAARTSGVNPMKYKVINFTISCFIAGLCGGFYAHFIGILTPEIMSTKKTVEILVIAYIGGRGSIWGPLITAFMIIPAFEYLNFLLEYKFVIYGLLLIVVMIFYPSGLSGFLNNLSSFVKRKVSERSVNK
ncbi:Branched-chain amino acid transport system permease protein LivM [Desulfosporosinus sp. I2]|uniref:branched-chain amino acid ABC transporter permease n=1 Tax=Desulfosporosinus sp. I2 TaxID=1617025 RepID=UPI0005F0648E|nr:branched-chain amino acid ABC transporter permease [Desulfosporosinus sp. I2]KJR49198.1 Branched-chain amino acid transport system permease protein LivM [Desulfosporosinus sp. I2]